MAKKKKKSHSKAKKAHKKSRSKSSRAKRAYKGSALHKYNLKRKKKGSKSKKAYAKSKGYASKKKSHKGRHKAYSGSAVAARARFNKLVERLQARGHDKKTAVALAHRAQRIGSAMQRGAVKHAAAVKAERTALSNLFGGIGAAGHLAAMQAA